MVPGELKNTLFVKYYKIPKGCLSYQRLEFTVIECQKWKEAQKSSTPSFSFSDEKTKN